MGIFATLRRHRTAFASGGVVGAAVLVVSTLAVLYQGVTTADVTLNDAGVWVTNSSSLLVGRLNYPSEALDAALHAKGASFDIAQQEQTVLVHDLADSTVTAINPAEVTLGTSVALPEGASFSLGGATVSVLDPSDGRLWTTPLGSLEGFNASVDTPVSELGGAAAMVVGLDGTTFGVSKKDGTVTTIVPGAQPSVQSLDGLAADADLSVTAVGAHPVVLDSKNGVLYLQGRAGIRIENAAGATLQAPGADAQAVAYSTSEALVSQPLDGSAASVTDAGGSGVAVAPVFLAGCTYAAWTGSGRYVRDCNGGENDVARAIDSLSGDKAAVFRVNRDAIVLNDLTGGLVWMVNQDMKEVSDWKSVTPPPDASSDDDADDSAIDRPEDTIPPRDTDNVDPVALDDSFGVRPGRSVILPVLDNDTDANGDVLTVSVLGNQPSLGAVKAIAGGTSLQISVGEKAKGAATFRYQAADGRGGKAVATVKLSVSAPGTDLAPTQTRIASVVVEQGAKISYDVLTDWRDPDGDDLHIASAVAADPSAGDIVGFRPDGLVTFSAVGAKQGTKTVLLTVSDGTLSTEGKLTVTVRPPSTVKPVLNADHASTLVNQPVTIAPLANDISPSGVPLTLIRVKSTTGATIVPDYTAGTFTFVSGAVGSYYLQYQAAAGSSAGAGGLVRVDVLPATKGPVPPVAVKDSALLPAGGNVLVDVLQNDSDPAGGLIVVQSVDVPPDSGISVSILEHNLLRITDQPGITDAVAFSYTISNGTGQDTASVLVTPTAAAAKSLPPVTADDDATVRAGDTVTVDVLANDSSPSGDTLTVLPDVVAPLPEAADGAAFVSNNTLRFRAGATAKTIRVGYQIADSLGQRAAGTATIHILAAPTGSSADQPPRPKNVDIRALAGTIIRIPVPLDGIDPDGDSVTLVGQNTAPTKGRVDEVGDTYLTYLAYDTSAGTDIFTYQVIDAYGLTGIATIRVGIAAVATKNQNPDAVKDAVSVQPGRQVSVDVLQNDTDPDGDILTLKADGLILPAGLQAVVSAGRVLVTAPAAPGQYPLQYTVADARGATAVGSLLLTVATDALLKAPVAVDDIVTPRQLAGNPATIAVEVLKNDSDPDGVTSALTVSVLDGDATVDGGTVVVSPTDVRQIITYQVTDVDGRTGTAFVRVPSRTEQAPSLKPDTKPIEVRSGETTSIQLVDYVDSPSGKPLRLTQVDHVSAAHAVGDLVQGEARLSYTSATGYFGPDAISFEVTDGTGPDDPAGRKATLVLPITVLPLDNQPPTFAGGAVKVAPGEPAATLDLAALSTDPDVADRPKLVFALVAAAPAGVTASLSGSVLSVSVESSVAKGTRLELPLTVTDGETTPVPGTVTITVSASTRPLAVANDDVVPQAAQGRAASVDVLANDVNPFPDSPLTLLDPVADPAQGTAVIDGDRVVVTPASTLVGTMTVQYRVQDATGDVSRQVTGTIVLTVQGRPGAPSTPVQTSVGDGKVSLSWGAGTTNGSDLEGYTVSWGRGANQPCPTAACEITGLANGTSYTFTVVATNGVGDSDPSPASAAITPDTRPGAPTLTGVDYGDGSLTVSWAKGTNTGSALVKYQVQVVGARTAEVPANRYSTTIKGLTNGQTYAVTVLAFNSSPDPSDPSGSIDGIPAGAPFAPTGVSVSSAQPVPGGSSQVTVTWEPLANSKWNAEALTGYVVRSSTGSEVPVEGNSTTFAVTNSTAAYTFTVAATNKATDSGRAKLHFSEASEPLRAIGKPTAPTITDVTEGDNSLGLTWTGGGGSGVSGDETSYLYDLNGDGNWRPAASSVSDGISNNTAYTVRMITRVTVDGNHYDSDATDPTAEFRPSGAPGAPTSDGTGNASTVTFTWSPPAPNGRPISYLETSVDDGGWTRQNPVDGALETGNGYSQSHWIRVRAVDSDGRTSGESRTDRQSGPAPAPTSWQVNAPVNTCAEYDGKNVHHTGGANPTCSSRWYIGPITVVCYVDWTGGFVVNGDPRWYRVQGTNDFVARGTVDGDDAGMNHC